MSLLLNRCQFTTATTGTGTITVGSATSKFQTPASAGAVNGGVYSYAIEDGTAWEVGTGTYSTTGPTLTRTLIQSSTGSLLSLSGSATVTISPNVADWGEFGGPDQRKAGRYYPLIHPMDTLTTGSAYSANTLYLRPIIIGRTTTFDRLVVNVTTAGSAGTFGRAGIYGVDINGYPAGAPLYEIGPFSVAATGTVEVVISGTLQQGMYWIASVSDGTPAFSANVNSATVKRVLGSNVNAAAVLSVSDLQYTHTFAALPALALTEAQASNFTSTNRCATIGFRAA